MSGESCIIELFGFFKGGNFNFLYLGVVRLFHLLKKGNQVLSICKELLSCFSHANKRDFHENPDHIYTELSFINPLSSYYKKIVCLCRLPKYLKTLRYSV